MTRTTPRRHPLLFSLTLLLLLSTLPSDADVRGIAFGFTVSRTVNFDGVGGCRLLIAQDRLTVIDFPAGDLASACEGTIIPGSYIEVVVEDAPPIPCIPGDCSKVSEGGHFIALSGIS